MGKYTEKLISISSSPLNQEKGNISPGLLVMAGSIGKELEELLSKKNGFFAFESALRFFPTESSNQSIGLNAWNSESLWRSLYSDLAEECLFFAEDIFGGQFCIKNNSIFSFDPETGALEEMGSSIEQWSQELLNEYNLWTGFSLAHEWQAKHGKLSHELRLMPKIPFVCGGEFCLDNLTAINAISGMKTRANLALQILNMPDGAQIEFNIIE